MSQSNKNANIFNLLEYQLEQVYLLKSDSNNLTYGFSSSFFFPSEIAETNLNCWNCWNHKS